MGRKLKETSVEERKIILNMRENGAKLIDISKAVKRSISTVQSIIQRCGERGFVQDLFREGRPGKLTFRDETQIKRQIDKDPKITATAIAKNISEINSKSVSGETIRRVLHRYGYRSRIARRKPFVSKQNRKKRIKFAKMYLNYKDTFWNTVLFSDETKFNIMRSDGQVRVWQETNTELEPKNITGSVKYGGGSVTLWGCMAAAGVGTIHFIKDTMDQYQYIEILKQNLSRSVQKLELPDHYYFQQDNDPKHTALNTRLWLLYNVPNQLKTPPHSPDLNPIEHIWAHLEREIRKRPIGTKSDLIAAIEDEWSRISQEKTNNLVLSMHKRVREVLKRKGYPTRY